MSRFQVSSWECGVIIIKIRRLWEKLQKVLGVRGRRVGRYNHLVLEKSLLIPACP